MTCPENNPPKVLLAVEMANAAGRQQMIGILRFLAQTERWDIRIVQPPSELTEEAVVQAVTEGFDGIVSALPCRESARLRLARAGIPTVLMDIDYPSLPAKLTSIVRIDEKDIANRAADHLLGLGAFNDYGFVPASGAPDWSVQRGKHFREILVRRGRRPKFFRAEDDSPNPDLENWLRSLRKPAAVFCANDTSAIRTLETCHRADIDVPSEVSVLGVDDDEYLCGLARPPLSSVRPDFETEGFVAARELARLMAGRGRKRTLRRIRATGVTERASTCRLSPAVQLVNRALEFIRLNACRNITVVQVVAHLGVSRRLADLRFRQIEGRSILEAITETRLEAVRRQLIRTSAPVEEIARACGFPSPAYLRELFRRQCGLSMSAYRKRGARQPIFAPVAGSTSSRRKRSRHLNS